MVSKAAFHVTSSYTSSTENILKDIHKTKDIHHELQRFISLQLSLDTSEFVEMKKRMILQIKVINYHKPHTCLIL